MLVFPGAGVDGSAAQADDDGEMLDADGALEFAGSAGGALEGGFGGDVQAEEGLFAGHAELGEIVAHAENDLLWVKEFACVGSGTVFGAATAFDAGERLEDG